MAIDPKKFYTPAEAADVLGVKEATIKNYCRAGSASGIPVDTKRVGPKKEWRIRGSSILRIRTDWGLDS